MWLNILERTGTYWSSSTDCVECGILDWLMNVADRPSRQSGTYAQSLHQESLIAFYKVRVQSLWNVQRVDLHEIIGRSFEHSGRGTSTKSCEFWQIVIKYSKAKLSLQSQLITQRAMSVFVLLIRTEN